MKGYIYTRTKKEGVYVGSTFNLKSRSSQHKCELEIIEEVEVEERAELVVIENYWIEQLRQWGFSLENRMANLSYIPRSKPKISEGMNVRFSSEGHDTITSFCDTHGYKVGSYCEIAVLNQIKSDSLIQKSR